jgi:RimJ/RimL family protein N-acetyltransferase
MERSRVLPEYVGWLNDRELMRFSRQRLRPHTRESCLEYLASFEGTPNLFWAIEERDPARMIGTATAYLDVAKKSADVGILVGHPAARGRGLATEAWGLVLRYLFEVRGLAVVTGGTDVRHAAMLRVFRHHGMTPFEHGPGDVAGTEVVRYRVERAASAERASSRSARERTSSGAAPTWSAEGLPSNNAKSSSKD